MDGTAPGTLWTNRISITDQAVEVLAPAAAARTPTAPPSPGARRARSSPAYVSTRLGTGRYHRAVAEARRHHVHSELPDGARGSVELIVRRSADSRYLFLVNRTDATVPLTGASGDLLIGRTDDGGAVVLAPRDVAVLRQPAL